MCFCFHCDTCCFVGFALISDQKYFLDIMDLEGKHLKYQKKLEQLAIPIASGFCQASNNRSKSSLESDSYLLHTHSAEVLEYSACAFVYLQLIV